MVEVQVLGVVLEESTKQPVLVLRAVEGDETLPIQIGYAEAAAIAAVLEHVDTPRPMTHDLLNSVVNLLQGTVERVEIDDLVEGTFYAKLRLKRGRTKLAVDCRPSDAVALALRARAPIYVADAVFRKLDPEDLTEASRRGWMAFLDSLREGSATGEGAAEGGEDEDADDDDDDKTVN